MTFSVKKSLYFFVFSLSWLLLLLLGESYFNYFLWGLITIALALFSSEMRWRRVFDKLWILIAWFVFLIGLALSFVFSISLPLSLQAAGELLFTTIIFWHFFLLDEKFMPSKYLLKFLLLIGLVMVFISLLFQASPQWANYLPGLNLLYATYGHNHLSAFLLLLLPFSWWFSISKYNQEKNHIWWLLPTLFSLTLLVSFGRVATFIGLIQFLVIWKKMPTGIAKKIKILPIFITTLFVGVIMSKLFFSIATTLYSDFSCPVKILENRLCKPLSKEPRPEYWRRTVEMIKNKPIWGSGPGTFKILEKKYHLNPFTGSSYAHNDYLQLLAELGLVGGGLFISLMVSLLIGGYRLQRTARSYSWQNAVFIGVASIYADVLFDFDWNFVSLLGLTALFLALLLKQKKTTKNKLKHSFPLIYTRIFYYTISLFVVIITGIYFSSELLIRSNKVSAAFDFFPYFHWHRKIFETNTTLDSSQKKELIEIYSSHPEAYRSLSSMVDDPSYEQALKERWAELDPWQFINQDLVSYYVDREEWIEADKNLDIAFDSIKELENQDDYTHGYSKKEELVAQMLKIADGLYRGGHPQQAAKWYQRSRWIDEWQLSHHSPIFLKVSLPEKQQLEFFSGLESVPGEFFGEYRSDYASSYLSTVMTLTRDKDEDVLSNLIWHLDRILQIADWERWHILEEVGLILINSAQQDLQQGLLEDSYQNLSLSVDVWHLVSSYDPYQVQWKLKDLVASLLVEVGSEMANEDMEKTLDSYYLAQDLTPWIFHLEPFWFKKFNPSQLTAEELEIYINFILLENKKIENLKHEDNTYVLVAFLQKLIQEKEYVRATDFLNQSQDSIVMSYKQKNELSMWLQEQGESLAKEQQFLEAEQLNVLMGLVLPNDYWVMTQSANLAVLNKEYGSAKNFFQKCQSDYKNIWGMDHQDCLQELNSLEKNQPNQDRYWEVSQIIRGEAIWQDFSN